MRLVPPSFVTASRAKRLPFSDQQARHMHKRQAQLYLLESNVLYPAVFSDDIALSARHPS